MHYEIKEKAYILTNTSRQKDLHLSIKASPEKPVFNPVFVIKGWGDKDAEFCIDGKKIKSAKDFRFGHRDMLEQTDLIVWIKKQSEKPIEILLSPVAN
jgi:hypothetical protein